MHLLKFGLPTKCYYGTKLMVYVLLHNSTTLIFVYYKNFFKKTAKIIISLLFVPSEHFMGKKMQVACSAFGSNAWWRSEPFLTRPRLRRGCFGLETLSRPLHNTNSKNNTPHFFNNRNKCV